MQPRRIAVVIMPRSARAGLCNSDGVCAERRFETPIKAALVFPFQAVAQSRQHRVVKREGYLGIANGQIDMVDNAANASSPHDVVMVPIAPGPGKAGISDGGAAERASDLIDKALDLSHGCCWCGGMRGSAVHQEDGPLHRFHFEGVKHP